MNKKILDQCVNALVSNHFTTDVKMTKIEYFKCYLLQKKLKRTVGIDLSYTFEELVLMFKSKGIDVYIKVSNNQACVELPLCNFDPYTLKRLLYTAAWETEYALKQKRQLHNNDCMNIMKYLIINPKIKFDKFEELCKVLNLVIEIH